MILFSATNNSFYDSSLEARYVASGNWPNDLIEMSDEDHAIYSGQPPEGKTLGSIDGKAEWVPHIITHTWDSLNQERVQALAVLDLKSIRALREGDSVRINELEAQAQAIRDTFEVPNG